MKHNLNEKLYDLKGKPLKDGGDKPEYVTDEHGDVRYTDRGYPVIKLNPKTGDPVIREGGEAGDATVQDIIEMVLGAQIEGDDKLSGTKKREIGRLARKVAAAEGEIEFSKEEEGIIVARAEKVLPWLTYDQLMTWFETAPEAASA